MSTPEVKFGCIEAETTQREGNEPPVFVMSVRRDALDAGDVQMIPISTANAILLRRQLAALLVSNNVLPY